MVRPQTNAANVINAGNPSTDDGDLIRMAKVSRNGATFTSLWEDSTTGYCSQSEADMALCSHLAFWTGKDPVRMDDLFRQSGLMREKWDRPQAGTTYGAITIQKAIENCKEVYTLKRENKPQFPPLVPLTPQWSDLPPFPVDTLPDTIRRYVSTVAEHSQTALDMAAVISLGVLAVCLQGNTRWRAHRAITSR